MNMRCVDSKWEMGDLTLYFSRGPCLHEELVPVPPHFFEPPGTARARRLFGNAIVTAMTLTTYLLYVAAIALLILTPGT